MERLARLNQYLDKVGAKDVKLYDLRGISSLFDYVFICTVDVTRQAAALVDYISKAKKTNEFEFRNMNGEGSNWTLIDLNDILLNIFTYEERIHYDLERLYVDVPTIDISTLVLEDSTEGVIEEDEIEVEYVYADDEELEEVESDLVDEEVEYEEEEEETPASTQITVNLEELTIPGLKALCKQYGIKGYSTLRRAELLEVLSSFFSE